MNEPDTPYDGSDARRCNSKTRSTEDHRKKGTPCQHWKGFRTGHAGVGNCYLHGGSTSSHKTHAVKVQATQRMVKMGVPLDEVTAPAALMGLLRACAGAVAWLQQEIAGLTTLAGPEPEILVKMYDNERDRLTRVAEACVRAGVAEHLIRAERTQAELTLRAIRDAAGDAGLNPTQLQALGTALHKRLAQQSEDPEQAARDAAEAEAKLDELRQRIKGDDDRRIARAASKEAERLTGIVVPPAEWTDAAAEPPDPAA